MISLIKALIVLLAVTECFAKLPAPNDEDIPDLDKFISSLSDKELHSLQRIIGGEVVGNGDWPWLVHLEGDIPTRKFWGITLESQTWHCGGSLVAERWVLTAAHCFDNSQMPIRSEGLKAKNWRARLGDVNRDENLIESLFDFLFDTDTSWEADARSIIIHPNYKERELWKNDIALMKLKDPAPVDGNGNIAVVKLPTQGDYTFPADGEMCVMKGWGCTSAGGSVSDVARVIEIPKISDSTCVITWGLSEMNTRLCAGYNLQSIGICAGDSGGPLTALASDGSYVQVGIASFTSANSPGQWPGGFTRVAHYVTWIKNTINN